MEFQVWQYITLTRRIYLIDCPGIVPTSAHDSQTATVLKGVLRVEALPMPSEHISELLMRLKPLYLARTYGLNVPEAGSWAADDFLDMLARAKGRLLKGGEPDIEGAAKVVLADWVRGRIPYFVSPPERSAELNEREAKERARLAKGKGKESIEDKRVPGVKQNLGSIMQKNTFVEEDVRPLEGIDLEGESEDGCVEEEGDDEAAVDGEDVEAEDDAPLAWGDVFVEERSTEAAGPGEEVEEEGDEGEEWSGITSLPGEGA
jgi:nuclear GTP-binding protein